MRTDDAMLLVDLIFIDSLFRQLSHMSLRSEGQEQSGKLLADDISGLHIRDEMTCWKWLKHRWDVKRSRERS